MAPPAQDRDMRAEDLIAIGYHRAEAARILQLLSHREQLQWYLQKGSQRDCHPITRLSPAYPYRLRQTLGLDSPSSLWYKGDPVLLEKPAVALVGSRDLKPENQDFAWEVGRQAAQQGFTLISGNARGSDRVAQQSCLDHGGTVISVVADRLEKCPVQHSILFLAEDGFDLDFSAPRALLRNRIIHALAQKVFVAQIRAGKGGTWDGSIRNLRHGWSPVFCYDDNSPGFQELVQMGAVPVTRNSLADISSLKSNSMRFIDQ